MHVAFVLFGLGQSPIGGFRVVYQHANWLVERGHRVTIVHAERMLDHNVEGPRPEGLRAILGRLKRRSVARLRNPRLPREVPWQPMDPRVTLRFHRRLHQSMLPDADVVIATAWQTAELVALASVSKGAGHYLVQHHETWSGPHERVEATWHLPLRKLVIAKWLMELLCSHGVHADELRHIPSGMDNHTFTLQRPIAGRPPRVAMMYSSLPFKASGDGLAALEHAHMRLPSMAAVVFSGEPPGLPVPGWIELVVDPSVDVLVSDIYNGSAVYLCSSLAEGWHLPPAEAMACGCAVVTTDIPGVSDYAEDGVTAFTAPAGEPEALGAALVRALTDEEGRQRIAEAGSRRIAGYSREASVNRLIAVLEESVGD